MSSKTIINEIERVPAHLTNLLEMLVSWAARLNNELEATPTGQAPDAGIARQLSEVTKTSMAMAKEMRAWVDKINEVVANLSLEDKIRVSLNLIQDLSVGDRLATYNHIRELEAGRPEGGIVMSIAARKPRVMTDA